MDVNKTKFERNSSLEHYHMTLEKQNLKKTAIEVCLLEAALRIAFMNISEERVT